MHRAERAHHGTLLHDHVAGQRGSVHQHAAVADHAVVPDVRVGHDQRVAANLVTPPPFTVPRVMVTHSRISLWSPISSRVGSPL